MPAYVAGGVVMEPPTVGELLARSSLWHGTKIAIVDGGRRVTYQEFNGRVNALAHAMLDLGVCKGDRIALVMPNRLEFLEVLFAGAKIGAVVVPINLRLAAPEVRFILEDSGAMAVFYDALLAPLVEAAAAGTAVRIRVEVGERQQPPSEATSESRLPSPLRYDDVLGSHQAKQSHEPETQISFFDPHLMMYTSGTTGRPKGAVLTHSNTVWNAINVLLHEAGLETRDVVLTVAPLFHIGGLNIHTVPAIFKGCTVVLDRQFDPRRTLQLVEHEKVSVLFLVPAMWQALMQVPDFDAYDLSSLRVLVSGGAPCPLPVIEFFQARGFNFLEGFGMTETAPDVAILSSRDAVRKNGSIGLPVHAVQVRIVDDLDHDVPPGQVGELVVRGPNVCVGYWNNPEATAEAFRGGWFHTGDLARQDEEGFYYIVDRKKDMLISGGENVYPVEIEQVLVKHPKVREVAVVGAPDERWGEVPVAFVTLKEGETLTLDEVASFCEGKLARFKIPKELYILDSLPRNATGKVLKNILRQRVRSKSS